MNIIFDLDGTIIDSSDRLYNLFQFLVPESNFTKNEYWDLKRDKVDHEHIIDFYFPNVDFGQFNDGWMKLIENRSYIESDKLFPDTVQTLESLHKLNNLVLLTARQSKEMLLYELDRLGIRQYFECILITERKCDKLTLLDEAIKSGRFNKNPNDLFVSDMGKDIMAGKKGGYRTVAITHGFMRRIRLEEYEPDYIIDELNELVECL